MSRRWSGIMQRFCTTRMPARASRSARVVVGDPELKPHGGRPRRQREDLARVVEEILGTPEDVDQIGRLVQIGQASPPRALRAAAPRETRC
jgi:hypothetical protein